MKWDKCDNLSFFFLNDNLSWKIQILFLSHVSPTKVFTAITSLPTYNPGHKYQSPLQNNYSISKYSNTTQPPKGKGKIIWRSPSQGKTTVRLFYISLHSEKVLQPIPSWEFDISHILFI